MPRGVYVRTAEYRAKLSAAGMGNQNSLGVRHTQETRDKHAAYWRGRTHSPEARAKISAAQKGIPASAPMPQQVREKIRAIRLAHLSNPPDGCKCGPCRPVAGRQTYIEKILIEELLCEFPQVEVERKFGRYRVDAYLPAPYHIAFEADGKHWHRDQERDARRDAWLLKTFELPVVRLTGEELYRMQEALAA